MCGIIALYRQGVVKEALQELANESLKRLFHRGPDAGGVWCEVPCVIGHRRLSIIDIEGSTQPMVDPSQRFVLSYNGEVYNFRELREELKHKWEFKTKGDTEVVLAGLIIYGSAFLKRMEGMWALALWDKKDETFLLSRDRLGQKPLYYQYNKNGFVCASELPALTCLSLFDLQEDLNSTADYLRYGFYLPGYTIYQDVFEILPGHVLEWNPQRGIQQEPYWSLPVERFKQSKPVAHELLREKLVRGVKRRLLADVEVGAFLSGGVDSSLIVSILTKELDVKPKTFTIGFTETSYDERKYATLLAQLYKTDHYEESFKEWNKDTLIKLVLDHVGQPFADSSILPTAMVSELAASKVKVALSGDGADELFSGYQRFQAHVLLRWFTRLPLSIRKNIGRVVKSIPEPMSHHSDSLLKKAHLFVDIANNQQVESPYIAPELYSQEEFRLLVPQLNGKGHTPPALSEEYKEDSLIEMMATDALVYLPQDILVKVDRASMAYSLEARAPFLDSEVVELALSLPSHWHRSGFSGKKMLRGVFRDFLPNTIWSRRKQGFVLPIHKWFRNNLEQSIIDLLQNYETPFDYENVLRMIEFHKNGTRDNSHRLWSIFIYLLWLTHEAK